MWGIIPLLKKGLHELSDVVWDLDMFSDPLFHFIPTNAQSVTILNCEEGNHERGHCFGGGSNGKLIQLVTSHKHETKVDNDPGEID